MGPKSGERDARRFRLVVKVGRDVQSLLHHLALLTPQSSKDFAIFQRATLIIVITSYPFLYISTNVHLRRSWLCLVMQF